MGVVKVACRDQMHSAELIALSDDGKLWTFSLSYGGEWHTSDARFGSADNCKIFKAAQKFLADIVQANDAVESTSQSSLPEFETSKSPHLVA